MLYYIVKDFSECGLPLDRGFASLRGQLCIHQRGVQSEGGAVDGGSII